MSDRYAGRSIHGVPLHARRFAAHPFLEIEAEGGCSCHVSTDDIAYVERTRFLRQVPAHARRHWPDTDWSGVTLSDLMAFVEAEPRHRWIQVLGGPLASVLPIDAAGSSILADRIAGKTIPVELGGPYRLVCPTLPYNLCVKWVDRIVLTEREPDRSVERVAAARQRAREARQ